MVIRDTPEHIDFHVKSGDYFAFVATMMGFIEETLRGSMAGTSTADMVTKQAALAKELRQDLRYLNTHYNIVPK